MCVCECFAYIHVCGHLCVCTCGRQMRASDSLELDLWMVVSHHVTLGSKPGQPRLLISTNLLGTAHGAFIYFNHSHLSCRTGAEKTICKVCWAALAFRVSSKSKIKPESNVKQTWRWEHRNIWGGNGGEDTGEIVKQWELKQKASRSWGSLKCKNKVKRRVCATHRYNWGREEAAPKQEKFQLERVKTARPTTLSQVD